MENSDSSTLAAPITDETNPTGPRLTSKRSNNDKSDAPTKVARTTVPLLVELLPHFSMNVLNLLRPSTFVPSARALFVMLDLVYDRLSLIKGFRETYLTSSYYPVVRLYFAYLFYLRTLQVQCAFGLSNQDQLDTYQKIISTYPLASWIIPEPFIPFFSALCAFKPSDPRFGPVLPALPFDLGATAARNGATADPYMLILPNMTSMLYMCRRIALVGPNGHTPDYFNDINSLQNLADVPAAHNAQGLNAYKRINVGSTQSRNPLYSLERHRDDVRIATANDLYVPPPFVGPAIANADVSLLMDYLKVRNSTIHLGRLMSAVEVLCIPFLGNTNLSTLPITDGALNSVMFTYDNEGNAYADLNAARNHATAIPLSGTATVHEPTSTMATSLALNTGLTPLQVQTACTVQLNVKFPEDFAPGSEQVGRFNGTLMGPYWNPVNLKTYAVVPAINPEDHAHHVIQEHLAACRLDKRP